MADMWATRDIGRAISSVSLGVFSAEGYDKRGVNNTSDGFGGYQECWVSGEGSQLLHPYERIWPADKDGDNKWDSMGSKWRPLAEGFNAIRLAVNDDPDAPRQTICRGRLDKEEGDIPLYYVPEALAPDIWIDAFTGTGPAMPANEPSPSSLPYFPDMSGDSGGAIRPIIKQNIQIPTNPFKPSSIDHLNTSTINGVMSKVNQDVVNAVNSGIRLWNVWDITWPSRDMDGRQYLKNFGPIYGSSTSYGPIIRQSGSAGDMTVEVIANRGAATVSRMVPVGYCIGRDQTYPWVFPYVDGDGVINHNIAKAYTDCERNPIFIIDKGGDPDVMDPPNLGFRLNIDVATGAGERTSFFGSSGSTPNVVVEWGRRQPDGVGKPPRVVNDPNLVSGEPDTAIRGFTAHIVPGKQAFLMYHNGAQYSRLFLSTTPVPQDIGTISLTVEYFGLSMFVTLGGDNPTICVRGYMPSNEKKYGVWVQPNDVSIHVQQCSIAFWFMPVYYDGWDPSIQSNFSTGPLTKDELPSTPVNDFFKNVTLGSQDDTTFIGGQSKITSISNFKIDPGDSGRTQSRVNDLIFQMVSNLCMQSPTGPEMLKNASRWALSENEGSGTGRPPYFQQDEGHIPLIRDSRMWECNLVSNNRDALPIKCWGHDGGQYWASWYNATGTEQGSDTLFNSPIRIYDTQTSITVMFRTDVTHTTPVIFGFKAHNVDRRHGWTTDSNTQHWESLDYCLEKWNIRWDPDVTTAGDRPGGPGKVMVATATITLLNPEPNVIHAISKNQMRLRIQNTGYVENAKAVHDANRSNPTLAGELSNVLYRQGIVFEGVSRSCTLTKEPGGQVTMEIQCSDPITMLNQALLESNIRFDGLSYLMSFSEMFRATDFADRLVIKMNPEQHIGPMSPSWAKGAGVRVAGIRSDDSQLSLFEMIYFGYHPMHANSFELHYGQPIYQALSQLLSIMQNPRNLPMFYYDPNERVTGGDSGAFKLTRRGMSLEHPSIYEQGGVDSGLPLLANQNESAYRMTSQTSAIRSHFTVTGTDRISGAAVKATSLNPNWNRLAGTGLAEWATTYGHLGYRSKMLQKDISPLMVDSLGCQKYVDHAMIWLMRPPMRIENLRVHGMIDPIAIEDGCIDVILGSKDNPTVYYKKAMLDKSEISYEAKTETVRSQVNVIIFPDETGHGVGF